jgi:hypothetical protein
MHVDPRRCVLEIPMRKTFAVLASVASLVAALPAVAQRAGDCPPGLEDKGCLPPGQAKKMRPYAPAPRTVYQQPVYQQPVYQSPVYQPPVSYGQPYRDYGPAQPTLNLGLTVPLQ